MMEDFNRLFDPALWQSMVWWANIIDVNPLTLIAELWEVIRP